MPTLSAQDIRGMLVPFETVYGAVGAASVLRDMILRVAIVDVEVEAGCPALVEEG